MRRLIAFATALALLVVLPLASVAGGPVERIGTDAGVPESQAGEVATCDLTALAPGAEVSTDGPVTLRLYQGIDIQGDGFSPSTAISLELSTAGGARQWTEESDSAGAFWTGAYFDHEDLPTPQAWVLTASDPMGPDACTDTLTITVLAATPFTDIGASPFRMNIIWMYHGGVTAGCTPTLYCPKGVVTREQMASFLVRFIDRYLRPAIPLTSEDFFVDDDSSVHEGAINRLAAAGLAAGCAPGRFCPRTIVSRAEMASFLARTMGWSRLPATGQDFFVDDEGSIHEAAINRLGAAGVSAGCRADVRWFCPDGSVTREQMAAFIDRAGRR
jgi:hypothetical protein